MNLRSDTMIAPSTNSKFGRMRPPQILILVIVRNEKKYGYEILKELREIFEGVWEPKTGAVYPLIKKLQDNGLLVSEMRGDKEYYGLSEEGRELLVEMLPKIGSMVFMATKFMTVATKALDDFGLEMSKLNDTYDPADEDKLTNLINMRDHMESELARIKEKIRRMEEVN